MESRTAAKKTKSSAPRLPLKVLVPTSNFPKESKIRGQCLCCARSELGRQKTMNLPALEFACINPPYLAFTDQTDWLTNSARICKARYRKLNAALIKALELYSDIVHLPGIFPGIFRRPQKAGNQRLPLCPDRIQCRSLKATQQ